MALALETFKVLETCINIVEPYESLSSTVSTPSNRKHSYREELRERMNYDHVARLVALGRGAQEFLRMVRAAEPLGRLQPPVSAFMRDERRLW